jgi:hypothetical protein
MADKTQKRGATLKDKKGKDIWQSLTIYRQPIRTCCRGVPQMGISISYMKLL